MTSKKVVLIIMDGWGHGPKSAANAIEQANTPFIDSLYAAYPHSELLTSGENVGLPEGQMGNSEVGHLNIGAGRIVYQDLVRINKAIRDQSFFKEPALIDCFRYVKKNGKRLHLAGLVSDGGVHSHLDHLVALCEAAAQHGLEEVYIHAFTDGRDTDPKSGLGFVEDVIRRTRHTGARVASVVGRYYAMDRDKRWERIREAYDLLVHGKGRAVTDPLEGLRQSYADGVTDEFIQPVVVTGAGGSPLATVQDGDAFLCFNFRTDRCREITQVLTQSDFPDHGMQRHDLYYVTMTNYDNTFRNVHVVYEKDNLAMTLGEVLSLAGKTQIRIAETEKYPHVTFFFSGGREKEFEGETRIMIPSPKVATYDLQPEMSAVAVTDAVVAELARGTVDFVCLNFANADMVGHTGVFPAVVRAVETVDACVRRVVEAGRVKGYSFLITADHGNADFMVNDDGTPNTAHTTNPVPLFLLDPEYGQLRNGRLCDLAPTILKLMHLDIPTEMTGSVLAVK
jgi:2,3-bisphosphoglycerate-independent phosphoglycerate mutase